MAQTAPKAPKTPKGFEHDGEAGYFNISVEKNEDGEGIVMEFSNDPELVIIPGKVGVGFTKKLLKFATALEAYAKYKPPKVKP